MSYSFDDADAAERHSTQYFEMMCNRGIYHHGWSAVTRHRTPWEVHGSPGSARRRRVGALRRHDRLDPGPRPRRRAPRQARRAAAALPDRSHQVQRVPARRPDGGTVQLRDRRPSLLVQRHHPAAVRRDAPPAGERGHQPQEQVALRHRRDRRPRRRRQRRDRQPGRHHRRLGPLRPRRPAALLLQLRRRHRTPTPAAPSRSPPGPHQVRIEFAYDGGGVGKGGTATLYVDGQPAGDARGSNGPTGASSPWTRPLDVGTDVGAPVSEEYGPQDNEFTGTVNWVQIDIGDDDHDHLISPEERFRLAMAKQ